MRQIMKKTTLLFETTLDIYLVTKSNGIISHRLAHSQLSRSFLKQWTQLVKGTFQALVEGTIKATDGSTHTGGAGQLRINAAAAVSYFGLVLGTGDTPVAIDDYKLQTQILHGSAANQLSHAAVIVDAHHGGGSTSSFKVKRQFENLSGGTITVKESGIYAYYDASTGYNIVRDVLTAPFDIANGQIAEFRYTIKATV